MEQLAELLAKYHENPNDFDLTKNIGTLYLVANDLINAKKYLLKANQIQAKDVNVTINLGIISAQQGDVLAAKQYLLAAEKLAPRQASISNNLGTLMYSNGQFEMAIEFFKQAIEKDPNYAEPYNNLAALYNEIKQPSKAFEYVKQAYALNPNSISILNNYATLLLHCVDCSQALNIIEQILKYDPKNIRALTSKAECYLTKRKFKECKEILDECIKLAPDDYEIIYLYGRVNNDLYKYEEAIPYLERAYNPNRPSLSIIGSLARCYLGIADWDNAAKQIDLANQLFETKQYHEIIRPFTAQILYPDPTRYLHLCKQWGNYYSSKRLKDKYPRKPYNHDKIRIGYISPDFKTHPVGLLINDLFSYHDRSKFDIYGFATEKTDSYLYFNICKHFDNLRELHNCLPYPDKAIDAIRECEIDILVDLTGTTANDNYDILSCQPAPVQCHMLGVTGTLATDFIQYVITTKTVAPDNYADYYTETLVQLPETEIARSGFDISKKHVEREQFGLPKDAIVYLGFHSFYRMDCQVFAAWMKILQNVKNSVLWLRDSGDRFQKNIKQHATKYSIDPDRIIFSSDPLLTTVWQHRLADIALDAFSFSAGTTTFLCAWAGIPTITCLGNNPHSRVAASYCYSTNVNEQVTMTHDEYIATAIKWGNDAELLHSIKQKLLKQRHTAPLFDPKRYMLHLEAAFTSIWKHFLSNSSDKIIKIEQIS